MLKNPRLLCVIAPHRAAPIARQADYVEFNAHGLKACEKFNLQKTAFFTEKLVQTYEMMVVRHGFMLVGAPNSAKTAVLRVLAELLTTMAAAHEGETADGEPTHRGAMFKTINPKVRGCLCARRWRRAKRRGELAC